MKEITVDVGCSYFDTNVTSDHYCYDEDSGMLMDIPAGSLQVFGTSQIPEGKSIRRIDIVVRIGD